MTAIDLKRDRLLAFADLVSRREQPLGADFDTQCWGAEAASVANENGQHPCQYFAFSQEQYEAAIRMNRELAPKDRNSVMARHTRELAGRSAR